MYIEWWSSHPGRANGRKQHVENTFIMMTLDYVGDREVNMVYAQLGQQPLARTTETSL